MCNRKTVLRDRRVEMMLDMVIQMRSLVPLTCVTTVHEPGSVAIIVTNRYLAESRNIS